eukprot:g4327.t1
MKHFIAELLKWRAKRQDLILSQVLTPSAVDRALETKLILATSQRHNDMVLCCGPRSSRSVASQQPWRVAQDSSSTAFGQS